MERAMTLDRQTLRIASQQGTKTINERNSALEKEGRKRLAKKATEMAKVAWAKHEDWIQGAPKTGATYYDIPIFQHESEVEHWQNAFKRKDGSRLIQCLLAWQHKVTVGKLTRLFTAGVLEDETKVRSFDAADEYRVLSWMVAKKLARKFLGAKHIAARLTVELLNNASVTVTTEYQKSRNWRSCTTPITLLRISWD